MEFGGIIDIDITINYYYAGGRVVWCLFPLITNIRLLMLHKTPCNINLSYFINGWRSAPVALQTNNSFSIWWDRICLRRMRVSSQQCEWRHLSAILVIVPIIDSSRDDFWNIVVMAVVIAGSQQLQTVVTVQLLCCRLIMAAARPVCFALLCSYFVFFVVWIS